MADKAAHLEELIGEIDESLRHPAIQLHENGNLEVDGTVRLDKLSEHFRLCLTTVRQEPESPDTL